MEKALTAAVDELTLPLFTTVMLKMKDATYCEGFKTWGRNEKH